MENKRMPSVIVNNCIESGNEEEAIRDGWFIKKPDGQYLITQHAPVAIRRHLEQAERIISFVKDGLAKGAQVEDGPIGVGEFIEKVSSGYPEKAKAYADALRAAGIDPDVVWEDAKEKLTPKESTPRLRTWEKDVQETKKGLVDKNYPKGRQVTPTPDGQPYAKPETKEGGAEEKEKEAA